MASITPYTNHELILELREDIDILFDKLEMVQARLSALYRAVQGVVSEEDLEEAEEC